MSIFHSSLAVCVIGTAAALSGVLAGGMNHSWSPELSGVIGGEFADPLPPVPATYLDCRSAGINCFEYQARHGTCGNAKLVCGPCPTDRSACLAGPCDAEKNVLGCVVVEIPDSCNPIGGGVILCGKALIGECMVTATDTGILCALDMTTSPPTEITYYLCTGGDCTAGTGSTPCSAVNCR